MPILFLNREDVETLLPMEECIEVVEAGLRVLARGGAVQPLRTAYWMPDRHGLLGVMPGCSKVLPRTISPWPASR